jgi:hypothetical protein
MYGTLLDQKVFESLVEKTMPVLWDHLTKSDLLAINSENGKTDLEEDFRPF